MNKGTPVNCMQIRRWEKETIKERLGDAMPERLRVNELIIGILGRNVSLLGSW